MFKNIIIAAGILFAGQFVHASVCTITAGDGSFYIEIDGADVGQEFPRVNDAVRVRNELLTSGTCVRPSSLPTCSIGTDDGYFIVLIGGSDVGLSYNRVEGANALKNELITAGACN